LLAAAKALELDILAEAVNSVQSFYEAAVPSWAWRFGD
jgi:hypothetical protein